MNNKFQAAMDFLQRGTFQPGTLEYKWWEYYDRIILDGTTPVTRYPFFSVPLGQGGKTEADTNWQIANQMPESERMAVFYLCFYYIPLEIRTQGELQEITNLLKTGWFQFKVYNKAPMVQFPLAVAFGNSMPVLTSGAAAGDQLMSRSLFNGTYELGADAWIPLAAKTTVQVEINLDTPIGDANLDGDKIIFSMVGPKWSFGN